MKEILIVVALIVSCLLGLMAFKKCTNKDTKGQPLTMEQTAKPRSAVTEEIMSITSKFGWKNDPENLKRLLELEASKKAKAEPTKPKFATCD